MKYFGYKWVLRCTSEGTPVIYDLGAASTDERGTADQVLDRLWQVQVIGDKGFIGENGQQRYRETRGLPFLPPCRVNPRQTRPPGFNTWLNGLRARIESAFHEVQNTGRHREQLRCQTVRGW